MAHSTKALTPEQKRDRIEAKKNEEHGVIAEKTAQPEKQIRKAPERGQRETRGLFNGTRGKVKVSDQDVKNFEEAGWHLHIFNDTPGRIEAALQLGYEFVSRDEIGGVVGNVVDGNTDLGTKVRWRVGMNEAGEGLFAYLMKVPKWVFYDEQAALEKKNALTDAAIRSGKNTKAGTSSDGFYDAGIKYENS